VDKSWFCGEVGSGTAASSEGGVHGDEAPIDGPLEGEWAGGAVQVGEGAETAEVDVVGVSVEESTQRCRRGVVDAPGALLLSSFLAEELHDRLEAIGEGAEEVGVEGVEPGLLCRGVEAVVADQAAHQRPVLLFDVAVVVLVEWPRASEDDLVVLAVREELVVDELAAGVGMDAEKTEGQLQTNATASSRARVSASMVRSPCCSSSGTSSPRKGWSRSEHT